MKKEKTKIKMMCCYCGNCKEDCETTTENKLITRKATFFFEQAQAEKKLYFLKVCPACDVIVGIITIPKL